MDFHTADEESITSEEESSSVYSDPTSLFRDSNYIENGSDSSAASNLSPDEKEHTSPAARDRSTSSDKQTCLDSPLPVSSHSRNEYPGTQSNKEDSTDKSTSTRNTTESNGLESKENQVKCYSKAHPQALSSHKNGALESNLMKDSEEPWSVTQSMLEHIQVIELIFQQEPGLVQAGLLRNIAKTKLIEKGHATTTKSLKELRKISTLLSEM
ncbi:hypothetical protein Bca52824_016713 [Brassica carinata]|uniref:Uncharacterized protein n=1 Tax=Brassica carinata TaxID=52824 RepID=A0A8X8B5Q3_BRACI|nr:hypothetical protein Bca52824_016713 [Brassica carinata]